MIRFKNKQFHSLLFILNDIRYSTGKKQCINFKDINIWFKLVQCLKIYFLERNETKIINLPHCTLRKYSISFYYVYTSKSSLQTF